METHTNLISQCQFSDFKYYVTYAAGFKTEGVGLSW